MIDITYYIANFTTYYRNHVKDPNGSHEVCNTSLDHLGNLLFDLIRCNIANIMEYGQIHDTYFCRYPALLTVSSAYFTIVGANIWSVAIRRYAKHGSPLPYGVRVELELDSTNTRYRIQAGSDTDISIGPTVQAMLEKVVWRLENELSDEEKVILMMSNIGNIKEFLLPHK
jgi:hypothetical protein